jgi:iron complex transport system substrate-binding protein
MDGKIDERDIECVRDIIKGSNDETELADANRDGKIDERDIVQIEKIIGSEQEVLHLLDGNGEPVAVKTPAQRIVVLYKGGFRKTNQSKCLYTINIIIFDV